MSVPQGQELLDEEVDWAHALQFDDAWSRMTGEKIDYDPRWKDLLTGPAGRYNFTADDRSFVDG